MVTTFKRQSTQKRFPFVDPNRVYTDEHELSVHGCGITPFTRTSVSLYDLPQRRWYELNIDRPMPLEDHEEWFEKTVLEHIEMARQPFNTINMNKDVVTYTTKENISRPLRPPIVSEPSFPVAHYSDISQKTYMRLAVDTCYWNGLHCVYKQLEFDEFIKAVQREISSREALLEYYGHDISLSEHGICPIIAIVVDGVEPLLCGILLPHAGVALDQVPADALTIHHLVSLIKTVKCLRLAQVVHGDICERNVCISGPSIQLVDFGDVAPQYQGDVVAVGKLLLWCVGRFLERETEILVSVSEMLIEREDLDGALEILEEAIR